MRAPSTFGEVASGAIAPDCHRPLRQAGRVDDDGGTEFHIQTTSVLVDSAGGARLRAMLRLSARNCGSVSGPMRGAKTLGNDEVQAFAQRLGPGEPEHCRGAGIPHAYDSIAVGIDDSFGGLLHDQLPGYRCG